MANFTVDENHTTELNQANTSTWLTGTIAFLSGLNIFLSITASLGNALILIALHKETSLHPPTKLLLRCLAVTDLCVGLISQPLFVTFIIAEFIRKKVNWEDLNYLYEGINVSSIMLCGMSILTSSAISVDRLHALLMGLRYRHVVTLRRTRAAIFCFFSIAVSCGAMNIWNHSISWITGMVFGLLSLITSLLSYTKIYLTLRQNQAQVQDHVRQGQQNGGGIPLNISRYKKTVSSIAWVQLALVACYAPFGIMFMLLNIYSNRISVFMAHLATATLVYLNSSLNPILYCWKIKEVRQAVKDTIAEFCCLCN